MRLASWLLMGVTAYSKRGTMETSYTIPQFCAS